MGRLSLLDRLLPVWIFVAMAVGIALGKLFPALAPALDSVKLDTVSLPIAIGLLWMMYPVLAKVKYGKIPAIVSNWKMSGTSLFLNWIVGPALMFVLAWVLLPDHPEYRTGSDHRWPGALYRYGADLEHAGLRRQRICGSAGGHQLDFPDRDVYRAGLLLPDHPARLAGRAEASH